MHKRLIEPERDPYSFDAPALCPKCKDKGAMIIRRKDLYRCCGCGHKGSPKAFQAAAVLATLPTQRT